jgi:U32 family peptidase
MQDELSKARLILQKAQKAKTDAVILWDMAVMDMARELGIPIHLSTQASVANSQALRFYQQCGAKRIVLARECTLTDIKEIKKSIVKEGVDCKIETFVHGAMCVSISGRCLMSYASHGLSANRGACVQPCRQEFEIKDKEGNFQFVVGENYVMSPKDLCAVDFLDELIEVGIDAFKIEGRIRSAEYVKTTVAVYREAIDLYFEGRLDDAFKRQAYERLATVYNRGFSTGFYFGQPKEALSEGLQHTFEKVFIGEVTKYFKRLSVAEIQLQADNLKQSDQILFIGKTTPAEVMTVTEMKDNHDFIKEATKGSKVGVKVPFKVKPRDKVFRWQRKGVVS